MFREYLREVRKKRPLVHNITNAVTVNDVANIILACGGSPIMSDEPAEAEDITSICTGLNINIGTLNQRSIEAMLLAGKRANVLNHPVLLDPVGAGASRLRTETVERLLREIRFTAVKGNISEIKTLMQGFGRTRGVDADLSEMVTGENLCESVNMVKALSARLGCVIAVTGEIDLVGDRERCYVIRNGRAEMERITGTGCQLAGMMTAFLAADHDHPLEAVAAATAVMGIAGEIGLKNLMPGEGSTAYRNRIIDAVYNMKEEELEGSVRYEVR